VSGIDRTTPTPWALHGKRVRLAEYAEVMPNLLPDGNMPTLIQRVFDSWPASHRRRWFHSAELPGVSLIPMTTFLTQEMREKNVKWGYHQGHRASQPGLSPFIEITGSMARKLMTSVITVHLEPMSPNVPVVIRAYTGTLALPLPWMPSARGIVGGTKLSEEYWNQHAFVLTRFIRVMREETDVTHEPPSWWRRR